MLDLLLWPWYCLAAPTFPCHKDWPFSPALAGVRLFIPQDEADKDKWGQWAAANWITITNRKASNDVEVSSDINTLTFWDRLPLEYSECPGGTADTLTTLWSNQAYNRKAALNWSQHIRQRHLSTWLYRRKMDLQRWHGPRIVPSKIKGHLL